jgi:hypothetical protein
MKPNLDPGPKSAGVTKKEKHRYSLIVIGY